MVASDDQLNLGFRESFIVVVGFARWWASFANVSLLYCLLGLTIDSAINFSRIACYLLHEYKTVFG